MQLKSYTARIKALWITAQRSVSQVNIQIRPKLHLDGKELLSQKQREGNNIYVTREAQVEDLTRKPTRGVGNDIFLLQYNSSGVLQ